MASKRPWLGSLLGLVESDCISIENSVQYMPRGEHVQVDRTMTRQKLPLVHMPQSPTKQVGNPRKTKMPRGEHGLARSYP
jgi:hypothetical protein